MKLSKTIRLGIPVITILTLCGCVFHVFFIDLAPPRPFQDPANLHAYVNGTSGRQNTLWKGTFYVGDRKGNSYFFHRGLHDSMLSIPAESWNPPLRFPRTRDKSKWLDWYQYSERLSHTTR